MNKIINLTQHHPTAEQLKEGVTIDNQLVISSLLTFAADYTADDLNEAAYNLTMLAVNNGYKRAMIGGMPALMPVLQNALLNAGVNVLYARSERVSQDVVQTDGSVRKVSVFAHRGFYEVSA
jgi:hypothetical protein